VLGLRSPDAGSIRVLGLDPGQDREGLHLIVGAQLQESALPAKLRVGEILDMYRSFYREPADAGELVAALGLAGKVKDQFPPGPLLVLAGYAVGFALIARRMFRWE
jgi:ABC-2 type transport system ATP-binding protein